MTDTGAEAWAEALLLFERFTFVAVSRREHEEWWYDVASIMRGEAQDPRGWQSLDPHEGQDERWEDPIFPFMPPPATETDVELWRKRVKEIPRTSVERLLVTLASAWLDVTREWEFSRRRPEMERRARVLLSRFPPGTRFFANTGWESENPDFYVCGATGVNPFTQYNADAGLIAVSDTEVGLVWSFDAT
ncbi:hypothetical protein [Streptomyces sp. CA-251247]|uniref:hypothetical protein n=1 Tax=Streptomyces sp. CA-251247 TaxID=3240062 RepID=UPI003D8F975D